jgi:hypothetical protein
LCGNKVSSSHVVGDLGVEIDEGMNYDAHINKIIGKAYSRIGVFLKGFASRNDRVMKKAYLTYMSDQCLSMPQVSGPRIY